MLKTYMVIQWRNHVLGKMPYVHQTTFLFDSTLIDLNECIKRQIFPDTMVSAFDIHSSVYAEITHVKSVTGELFDGSQLSATTTEHEIQLAISKVSDLFSFAAPTNN